MRDVFTTDGEARSHGAAVDMSREMYEQHVDRGIEEDSLAARLGSRTKFVLDQSVDAKCVVLRVLLQQAGL